MSNDGIPLWYKAQLATYAANQERMRTGEFNPKKWNLDPLNGQADADWSIGGKGGGQKLEPGGKTSGPDTFTREELLQFFLDEGIGRGEKVVTEDGREIDAKEDAHVKMYDGEASGRGRLLTKGQPTQILGIQRACPVNPFGTGSPLNSNMLETGLLQIQGRDDLATLYTITGTHIHNVDFDAVAVASRVVCHTFWGSGSGWSEIYWDVGESQTLNVAASRVQCTGIPIAAPGVAVPIGTTTLVSLHIAENGRGTGTGGGGGQVRFTDARTVGAGPTGFLLAKIPPYAQSILVWRTVYANQFQVLYLDDAGNSIGEIDVPASTLMPRTELQDGLRYVKIINNGAAQPTMTVYLLWGLGIIYAAATIASTLWESVLKSCHVGLTSIGVLG